MKLFIAHSLLLFSVSSAFSAISHARKGLNFKNANRSTFPSSTSRNSMYFAQETEQEETIYDKIGFSEENVALGIDPFQVAEWIGDREAIYTKIKDDNKDFDEARVNLEVEKFMMDAELVNFYIEYQKRKAAGTLEEKRNAPPSLLTIVLGAYVSFVAFNSLKGIFFKNEEAIDAESSDSVVQNMSDTVQNMNSSNMMINAVANVVQNVDVQNIADTASSSINF